ncbi:MAG: hypothetical protein ABI193_25930 [Minicystis sp.]
MSLIPRRLRGALLAGLAGLAALTALHTEAEAQEIQLTGPLAGAPAVRKLRLHRAGRFEIAPGVSFSLLDQYQRTIMPGATASYHFTDWIGVSLFGGYGIQSTTGLGDELQKIVAGRDCASKPFTKACKLTAVNLTHGSVANDQFGRIQWMLAPQIQVVPFRGKISLFSELFIDTDVSIFAGPAIVGVQERTSCGKDETGAAIAGASPCTDPKSFALAGRIAVAPTFGLGLNFYPKPTPWFGFGFDFRALPFAWNTSGFDNHGGGNNQDFPDNSVNGADREFHFNSMITLHVSVALPTAVKITE